MPDRLSCSTCGAPLQRLRIPAVAGSTGDTSVRLIHFPVLGCSEHERWEAYPDFNPEIIDWLFEGQRAFFTRSKGLVRRRMHCGRCDAALAGVAATAQTVEIPIRGREGLEFTLEVSGPARTCPNCQGPQIDSARSDEIVDAMVAALEDASIGR